MSFPPHLVRSYIEKFGVSKGETVLDPFCGTGTTLVECKKAEIKSIGIEANPVVKFAAETKTSWLVSEDEISELKDVVDTVAFSANKKIKDAVSEDRIKDYCLDEDQNALLIYGSISPIVLSKCLVLLEEIDSHKGHRSHKYMRLIYAKHIVHSFSNLKFGPEVGISRNKLTDVEVVKIWHKAMLYLISDLKEVGENSTEAIVLSGDARYLDHLIEDKSIDFVIASPPYPNEKDYSRTTRLESVVLGYMVDGLDLKRHKRGMLASNTKAVYVDDEDYKMMDSNIMVRELSKEIEARRIELGKTSGFEKLYHKVVKLYFGGMARHLMELRPKLKNGAKLAYVVGDQASYFQIPIRTGEILSDIALDLGYEVIGVDLFRTRFATSTQEILREEVLCLRVPEGGFEMTEDKITADSEKITVEVSVKEAGRYIKILEHIFRDKYSDGDAEVAFYRTDIEAAAQDNEIILPKNLGDVIYSFKYRTALPESIIEKAPEGLEWAIVSKGRGKYAFVARKFSRILPDKMRQTRKIPDATPSIAAKYTSVDEQALLTKLRYNRILDMFTSSVCHSLQNHLRTTVKDIGQVETDEIYVGVDKDGRQYVFPVQAKGGKDELGVVQIEQDIALCKQKFPGLICRAIAAQFIDKNTIAMFEFAEIEGDVVKVAERHYELVDAEKIDTETLKKYVESGDTE